MLQRKKCQRLVTTESRILEKQIRACEASEAKARRLIEASARRGCENPSQAKQAAAETRLFARELIRARKQTARVTTSKAQLESVGMQVNQALRMNKMQVSLNQATGIMKGVNTLVQLPELMGTMRELSQELLKADIVGQMTEDMMPDAQIVEGEDEAAESEVDKVLGEVLKTPGLPAAKVEEEEPFNAEPFVAQQNDPSLENMRGRLEALKS